MRSRAEWRPRLEWALRVTLIVVLGVALRRSVRASRAGEHSLDVQASAMDEALRRAAVSPRVSALDLDVDAELPAWRRDWLTALRRAGVRVQWHGAPPAMAVAVGRAREPVAPALIRVVADGGVTVVADSIGVVDSVRSGAASLEAADVAGTVRASRGAFAARASVPARGERRDVLVLGRAGWESRFVLAALGEAGWRVRARLPVAPGVSVVDATLLPLDTTRYDAVVALDSTAGDLAPQVARFIAQGGGVIAVGSALDAPALRALAPAQVGSRQPGRILLEGDTLTRGDLPLRPLVAVRMDAVVLQREGARPSVAVRRAGLGRVATVGYDETWRWRMQGSERGAEAHRAWWSRMVGLVAPEREVPRASNAQGDAAPRAALVAALGPPLVGYSSSRREDSARLPLVLLFLVLAALLAETASRRFRGAT